MKKKRKGTAPFSQTYKHLLVRIKQVRKNQPILHNFKSRNVIMGGTNYTLLKPTLRISTNDNSLVFINDASPSLPTINSVQFALKRKGKRELLVD